MKERTLESFSKEVLIAFIKRNVLHCDIINSLEFIERDRKINKILMFMQKLEQEMRGCISKGDHGLYFELDEQWQQAQKILDKLMGATK